MAVAAWYGFDLIGWRALEPPSSMTAAAAKCEVRLAWPEVPGASSYQVYRYERVSKEDEAELRGAGKDVRLGVPETETHLARDLAAPAFLDTAAEPGKRYVYRIKAATKWSRSRLSREFEGP